MSPADLTPQNGNGVPANGANGLAPPSGSGTPLGFHRVHNKLLDSVKGTPAREPSPQPVHLGIPGGSPRVLSEEGPGYVAAKFEGKGKQMEQVMDQLEESGFIPSEFISTETDWFYNMLGIDDMYFQTETVDAIASHILSLYAAKVAAYARDDKRLDIRLDKEAADHAVYIDTSRPGVSAVGGPRYEQRIDEKYIDGSTPSNSYRVETFRSATSLPDDNQHQLRCYFVYKCHFNNPHPDPGETNIEVIGEKRFLQKATENTKAIYQEIISNAVARSGPVIEMFEIEGSREKRLVVAYRQGSAMGFFSALSDLYHYYRLTSSRKYLENFSNGITVVSLYLRPIAGAEASGRHPPIEAAIHQIMKEVSLLYCVPQNKFQSHFASGRLSLQETIYAHCVWVFVQQFLNRLGSEYTSLTALLDSNNTVHAELLSKIKKRLRTETFTSDYILEIINKYPDLIHRLYLDFANTHYVQTRAAGDDFLPTLSYLRLQVDEVLDSKQLKDLVSKTVVSEHDEMVMKSFLVFNNAVLKTNFYTPTKVALSFRLNPDFLPTHEYPQPLYGMFLVISSEFRGFHLRFRDISRGGIRIVKSRDKEAYAINARSIFDENYNLANTQQRKNKDIPEGGAKGVILLDVNHQDKARVAFEKYIDSILDLLLPPVSPGIKDPIVDLHGQDEILFMGPDENTAELVDWATMHAKQRGAPWWKSFFTGKNPKLGGIPHDTYGMTTLSIRQYVEGIYRKTGVDETQIRKLQTGGPDGDLGSNEILLGREKYTAIVDGSGVIVDPQGLDREELLRLAKARIMISNFDMSKLSPEGYRVLVDDANVTLPNGEVVHNGTVFRNTFHLRKGDYDIFVPCGGRPESINLANVSKLIVDGKTTIPYLVEGANLFLSQDCKLRLEKSGCVLFKDASVNKGGVTSSSLEVLASLSFDDKGFAEHMCIGEDGKAPEFYNAYVREVQETIKRNATLEFEAIWREHELTGIPRSILSDTLSVAITKLDEELQKSELWDNLRLRKAVLGDALPKLLQEKIGLDTLLERVPDSYLRSIFGSYLASRFVYQYGATPGQFAFFDFMSKRMPKE
ncbi:NAD-dependent glutamate dehydrogenase [Coccidioides posadasii str. Silveira]|uniref:NAD-specific glutamate dehydrogenase n=3 Tax=Coccidioides posadasii TaxID=199306 RepID=A0A0J6F8D2_COCPO|nr:NAD-specific glutamate dehydrogenase, putative [Coccidioides posadasii C735 delta SOWgp]EER24002.1 NAD-specific glutamate dehydrogenase, putative [Coccidioides posadasii C735 delta SOWgp]KMM65545.1 NAD-specific glutamate dehydrogenase [Coccidioides posadasii RMSCC 3488]QVM07469.1 NAD-dependent glutamate dehydrogenase [Coccidioides posadasii str. Silveira]|eukprot:XP_003066147.1 NAD-specific glutamate dehydrogenase, putative [Coccidioides posadasii C735 delta SOWgp]